jgi:hypothetical protein
MIHNAKVTVGTSPTDLLSGVDLDRPIELHIYGGANVTYVGDSGVTVNNGYSVANEVFHLHGETLYAVVASSTNDVRVLAIGQ